MKLGNSYKEKPKFFYKCQIEDLDIDGLKIESPLGTSEKLFNTWDTIFDEVGIKYDSEEEKEEVNIKLMLYERISKGILNLRSEDIKRETIELTYNFKTGRWMGDDFFKDSDGYGHFVGDTFEVWFDIYQFDYDLDRIPFWMEVNVLGTDPQIDDSINDPDNDGIPTSWEWKWGYDPLTYNNHKILDPDIDGIENIEEYKMEKYFADPYQPDIYAEVDGMQKRGIFDWEHRLFEETKQIAIERYCSHNINIYIDDGWKTDSVIGGGELLPYIKTLDQDTTSVLKFYKHHFSDERKGIFRYVIVADIAGFCYPSENNNYDTYTVPMNIKSNIKNGAITKRQIILQQANGFLHEIGHSLGIKHWNVPGCDNTSFISSLKDRREYSKTWGQYNSVMNYYYFFDRNLVDYSNGKNNDQYDFDDWAHMYIGYFQTNSEQIEGASIKSEDLTFVIENFTIERKEYEYNKNLTEKFSDQIDELTFVRNSDVIYRIYERIESNENNDKQDILIYAKPDTEPIVSRWTLVSEGEIDESGNLLVYSQEDIIQNITK